jgi:hypothetical protein
MRINLPEIVYKDAFNLAIIILSEMQYKVQVAELSTGIIKAVWRENELQIIDVRFEKRSKNLAVSVFPGSITNDFKSINYDEKTAELFKNNLMRRNNNENLNSFRLIDEDYLSAL